MGTRQTYALACDGDFCEEVYFAKPRKEKWEEARTGNVAEIVTLPRTVSMVRAEAQATGWTHIFHPPMGSGPGWYLDYCPACTKEIERA